MRPDDRDSQSPLPKPLSAPPVTAMPVTHLVSRPSVEVVDGRLVTVLALVARAA
jgi:hypothetical protein